MIDWDIVFNGDINKETFRAFVRLFFVLLVDFGLQFIG